MTDDAEIQRLTERAAAAEARVAAIEAATVAQNAVQSALLQEGIRSDRLPLALKLVDVAAIADQGADATVAEAIAEVKATSPEWFGGRRPSAPDASSDGSGPAGFTTASHEEFRAELARFNVRPVGG